MFLRILRSLSAKRLVSHLYIDEDMIVHMLFFWPGSGNEEITAKAKITPPNEKNNNSQFFRFYSLITYYKFRL